MKKMIKPNWFGQITLVEVLVVVAIGFIASMIILASIASVYHYKKYSSVRDTKVYQCVKTYVIEDSKRVNLRPANGGKIITMECNDFPIIGARNSSELFAQFEPSHWYIVETVGYCDEKMQVYPTIIGVIQTEAPLAEKDIH